MIGLKDGAGASDKSQVGRLGEKGLLTNVQDHPSLRPAYSSWESMVKSFGATLPPNYTGDRRVETIRQAMLPAMVPGIPPGHYVGPGGKLHKSFDEMWDAREELTKALATTSITGFGDGTPLRLENLDPVITTILWQTAHFKLFKWLPHDISHQVTYEWNRRDGYGGGRTSGAFAEGGGPSASTGAYTRVVDNCMHYGVRRGTTLTAQLTSRLGGFHVDAVTEENMNGTKALLAGIERQLVWGNPLILDANGNTVNYQGLQGYMSTTGLSHYQDLQGAALTFHDIENACSTLITDGFLASLDDGRCGMFMSPPVLRDLARQKLSADFKILGGKGDMPGGGYAGGVPFTGYNTNFGFLPLDYTIFSEAVQGGAPLAANETGSPTVPGTRAIAAAAGTAIPAGTYAYWISAVNDAGESLAGATTPATLALVAPNRAVTLSSAASTGATAYRIYRSQGTVGSTTLADARWIATVPAATWIASGYTDNNQIVPGAGIAFIMSGVKDAFCIAELAPLMKWMLYPSTNTTQEFILLLIHIFAKKAWQRGWYFANVGTYTE